MPRFGRMIPSSLNWIRTAGSEANEDVRRGDDLGRVAAREPGLQLRPLLCGPVPDLVPALEEPTSVRSALLLILETRGHRITLAATPASTHAAP